MKKILLFAGLWAAVTAVNAQHVSTFDDVNLDPGSWYNGSDGAGGFSSGPLWFPNVYVAEWAYWSGFAVSNMKDTITPGYENQYSAITGGGAAHSENYVVVYIPGEQSLAFDSATTITGFDVTNSTLTYMAMRDGDINGFSKKFGGTQGIDPDSLILLVWGSREDGTLTDTIKFVLADYRFEDSEKDYIVRTWEWVQLEGLGPVTKLHFALDGSDKGDYGLNTPAYFCMDNMTSAQLTSIPVLANPTGVAMEIYPQPVTGNFFLEVAGLAEELIIQDLYGRMVFRQVLKGEERTSVTALSEAPAGIYIVRVKHRSGWVGRKVIKID